MPPIFLPTPLPRLVAALVPATAIPPTAIILAVDDFNPASIPSTLSTRFGPSMTVKARKREKIAAVKPVPAVFVIKVVKITYTFIHTIETASNI